MQDMKWQWIPGEQVGPIRIGAPIESLEGIVEVELDERFSDDLVYTDQHDNWLISVEDGLISNINCNKWCHYKGVNLVGTKIGDCLGSGPINLH